MVPKLLHSFQQIFCQNDFMRNILSSFKEDCRPSAKLNIFCPDYTSEELQYLVDFIYEGEFCCDNPEELEKISFILKDFGYSTDLKFTCQNGSDDKVFPQVQPSTLTCLINVHACLFISEKNFLLPVF